MKPQKLSLLFVIFLLVLPAIEATPEEDQLDNIIRNIRTSISTGSVSVRNWKCLNGALGLLDERMGEMVGIEGFLNSLTNPINWARQLLSFKIDFAISAVEKLIDDLNGYMADGNPIVTADYKPGWIRRSKGDECKSFNMKFIWLKNDNTVRVVAAGDCACYRDVKDFYIQFDVKVRPRSNVDDDEVHKYEVVGFSNSDYEYLIDPDDDANSVIKVNCCKECGKEVNWVYEEEPEQGSKKVSFSTPKKELFADPDEFLAALESGSFKLNAKEREEFLRGTLCTKIDDVIPKQISDDNIPKVDDTTGKKTDDPTGKKPDDSTGKPIVDQIPSSTLDDSLPNPDTDKVTPSTIPGSGNIVVEDGYCENLYLRPSDPDPDCKVCQDKINKAKEDSKKQNPEYAECPFINTKACRSCYFKAVLDHTVANCGGDWKLTTTDPCGS
ncbi:hypothetical protein J4206_01325 [Candidatus Woesearchaeota archaeon]|nr:hypothetical protein [Candidatus Woesearchaeota archaeon]